MSYKLILVCDRCGESKLLDNPDAPQRVYVNAQGKRYALCDRCAEKYIEKHTTLQRDDRKRMTDTGAEALMHAIVRIACSDWKKAVRRLMKKPDDEIADVKRRECERFFRSNYFYDLTGIPGKEFLEKLRRTIQ